MTKPNRLVQVVLFLLGLGIAMLLNRTDSTDLDRWHRSGAALIIDYGTGCEYLGRFAGITPRLNPDGSPVCHSH